MPIYNLQLPYCVRVVVGKTAVLTIERRILITKIIMFGIPE